MDRNKSAPLHMFSRSHAARHIREPKQVLVPEGSLGGVNGQPTTTFSYLR